MDVLWIKIYSTYLWPSLINQAKESSSRPEVFREKGVLRNFTKFTGKHLCQNLVLNKVAGLKSATLFKKRFWHRCFPVNFVKFLRTPFCTEHLWWLLLKRRRRTFLITQFTFTLCLAFIFSTFTVYFGGSFDLHLSKNVL